MLGSATAPRTTHPEPQRPFRVIGHGLKVPDVRLISCQRTHEKRIATPLHNVLPMTRESATMATLLSVGSRVALPGQTAGEIRCSVICGFLPHFLPLDIPLFGCLITVRSRSRAILPTSGLYECGSLKLDATAYTFLGVCHAFTLSL